ncbi:MAG: AbrB/MazE/SpoVT family DNA-binding domain-containing protein [Phenylobacterium sp.]|nr:AbrB/MazE/SpoVT family DNA-binding domain-containing protein [Phenylobacterium sp.]
MRITSKGQVTIPVDIRERAGLLPNTEVEFSYDGSRVELIAVAPLKGPSRGRRIVERLRGRGDGELTTDQIMAMTRGEE